MFMDIFYQPYDFYGLEVVTFYHFRSDQKFWNLPPTSGLVLILHRSEQSEDSPHRQCLDIS